MAVNDAPVWSSDTRISIPEAPDDPILVPMYGFGFTRWGLAHNLTDAEYEHFRRPTYAPEVPPGDVVFDDGDVG